MKRSATLKICWIVKMLGLLRLTQPTHYRFLVACAPLIVVCACALRNAFSAYVCLQRLWRRVRHRLSCALCLSSAPLAPCALHRNDKNTLWRQEFPPDAWLCLAAFCKLPRSRHLTSARLLSPLPRPFPAGRDNIFQRTGKSADTL